MKILLQKKIFGVQALAFFGLSVIFTFPLIFRLSTGAYGSFFDTDIRGAVWQLWWAKYALAHGLDYFNCPFVAAPFGISLDNAPISWMVYALFNFLLRLMSPIGSLNILIFASFVLTGVFSSLLMFRLTKNVLASFCGAVIFTFAPYHLNKVMEFSFFFLGNWVVLFFWSLIFLREKRSVVRALLSGCALGVTAGFSPYYGFFAAVLMFVFFLYDSCFGWRRHLKQSVKALAWSLVLFIVILGVAAIINFNVCLTVFGGLFSAGHASSFQAGAEYFRPLDYLVTQSARPLNYLLPASTHPFLGGFTQKMFGSLFYGRGSIEQTLFLGWIPLILALIAYKKWKKTRSGDLTLANDASVPANYWIGFFVFAGWIFFVCSMPPVLNLGIIKIYFPSYFIYKVFPIFRAYARFGMLVMLCVAFLASFGLRFLLERIRSAKMRILCVSFVLLGVLFEFTNIPPLRVVDTSRPAPEAYQWIKNQPGDFIIAEYPMVKGSPGEALENYDYLFQQTIHQKRLVNGKAASAIGSRVIEKIFNVDDERTPRFLKALGVKYVLLHADLYRGKEYRSGRQRAKGGIPVLDGIKGYRFVQSFGDTTIYEVNAEPVTQAELLAENLTLEKGR